MCRCMPTGSTERGEGDALHVLARRLDSVSNNQEVLLIVLYLPSLSKTEIKGVGSEDRSFQSRCLSNLPLLIQ